MSAAPTRQRRLPLLGASRRSFVGGAIAGAMGLGARFFTGGGKPGAEFRLRPPGAVPEASFADACARCFKCGNACPNGCIHYHGLEGGLENAFTPYVRPRERACILCGECAQVCPTGALRPFETGREGVKRGVAMGKARVNKSMCYSYHGRTCGACYQACPLAGEAIRIGIFETPILDSEACVGCGLCEQACLHLPQAIRVIPQHMIDAMEEA